MRSVSIQNLVITSLYAGMLLAPLTLRAAGPVSPDTGSLLQEMKPAQSQTAPSSKPGLKIESPAAHNIPAGTPFAVKTIKITGNTLFDTPTLHALVADGEGKQVDLSQLYQLAARITDYYHSHNYPLARAVIPAQTIHDGTVNIEVIEARYGRISLDNNSRVNDSLLQETLSPLNSGDFISQAQVDHTLLLLSDLPGIVINATLQPGDKVGTSDLQVQTDSPATVTGSLAVDNYGNRYTGRVRGGGSVYLINPMHHGDVLSANVLTSGSDLAYGRVGYELQFNGYGSRVGSSFTAVHYALGDSLQSLGGHGNAYLWNVWVRHPFIRSPGMNLYGRIEFDHKRLHDRIDTGSIRNDRFVNDLVLSLSGNRHDDFLTGGIDSLQVDATYGHLHFNDAVTATNDQATAKTQGGFLKWDLQVSRLQALTPKDSLYVAAAAQWTNGNLDTSEKLTIGGPYTVRAYDLGAESGDTGYRVTAELRHNFGQTPYGNWQARAFIDNAHVTFNHKSWAAGTNSATLTGAGIELDWTGPHRLTASLVVATPFGATPALAGTTRATRAWIEVSERF